MESIHMHGSQVKTLDVVQKKAVRFVLHRYDCYFSPTSTVPSPKLTTLSARWHIESLKLLHCIINPSIKLSSNHCNLAPETSTRRHYKLDNFFARILYVQIHNFFRRTIEMCNTLPRNNHSVDLVSFLTAIGNIFICIATAVLFCSYLLRSLTMLIAVVLICSLYLF